MGSIFTDRAPAGLSTSVIESVQRGSATGISAGATIDPITIRNTSKSPVLQDKLGPSSEAMPRGSLRAVGARLSNGTTITENCDRRSYIGSLSLIGRWWSSYDAKERTKIEERGRSSRLTRAILSGKTTAHFDIRRTPDMTDRSEARSRDPARLYDAQTDTFTAPPPEPEDN